MARKIAPLALTAILLASATAAPAQSWDRPVAGEAITVREACARRVKAEDHAKEMRFKSLPLPYGGARIIANRLVEYWTQYCPDNAKKVYLAEKK